MLILFPGWFQNTQLLDERFPLPPASLVTLFTLHRSVRSAGCQAGKASPSKGQQALEVLGTSLGVILPMQREYLSQFSRILYAKLDRHGGDDGKGTLPNFFLSIIWKNSSQFVIIPVLLHCFPPAEHITPVRLSGIQGPSRKDSPEFWINTE